MASAVLGDATVAAVTRVARAALGTAIPPWDPSVPRAAGPLPRSSKTNGAALYFPSCVSRVFAGNSISEPSLAATVLSVADRAGRPLWIPDDVAGYCCGMPFASKGFDRAYRVAVERTVDRLWAWTGAGDRPHGDLARIQPHQNLR